jgi:protein-L-isoaspartate(D-aspartate) O-methyltransferase
MKSLIANLIADNYLKSPHIIKAFTRIDRDNFVLPLYREHSHMNVPLPIGYNQTISQPATVAFMLELLDPQKGEKILDIGTGSGWTTALLAELVGPKGRVYGIELIKALKNFGERNVSRFGFLADGRVKMFCQDGRHGLSQFAPYDKILVSAATDKPPYKLMEQLALGGRMVIPIGESGKSQDVVLITRINDQDYAEEAYPGFAFVPLVKR